MLPHFSSKRTTYVPISPFVLTSSQPDFSLKEANDDPDFWIYPVIPGGLGSDFSLSLANESSDFSIYPIDSDL